jgi:pyruvate ferredoxin oxidoreductase gamma subunit
MSKEKKYIEVIWHGRGGQGAITASQLIAEGAYKEGFKGVTTAPSFGAERRGAPVASFLRLSHEPIRSFSQISDPDIVVVLDPTLLPLLNLKKNYRHNATVIVNSTMKPDEIDLSDFKKVGIADITRIALDNNLTLAGSAILNTPILGAFVKTTGLIPLELVEESISSKFSEKAAAMNIDAARQTYDATEVFEN